MYVGINFRETTLSRNAISIVATAGICRTTLKKIITWHKFNNNHIPLRLIVIKIDNMRLTATMEVNEPCNVPPVLSKIFF